MLFRLLSFAAVLILAAPAAVAQEVSWSPPPVYAERLQKHLTPVEPLRAAAAHANEKDRDGVVLVDEELQIILPDARRIIVEHMAMLAVTDAGAESLGRTERYFQKTRHSPHLALAQTILPDGKTQPVKKEGVFIQTPQREADAALYDDSSEIVIIFPSVKAGCVVEWITVVEETKARIPGEYTSLYDLQGGWPVRKLVRRVEMPDALAQRMKFTPLGSGVPEAERTAGANGHAVFTWSRSNVPGMHAEQDRAPLSQTGPCVFLTTLPDWNAFLNWYVPRADQSAVADDRLKALADEWTKDAKTPRDVVKALGTKVANDVRYVGLEFNDCDIEPHPAPEVWEHQYGDCKDKSSLLVALLRHKGIKAHMALINTEHTGRVERRSPDYRHFNHAIAVAHLEDGPFFIDATISGAEPGTLSPGDCDREVLLVSQPEQWLRTPAQRAGGYGLDFEAALAADGSLSGWATLRAAGFIGALYADYERTSTRDQVRGRLSRQAAQRWEGARVVDVKPGVRDAAAGTYEVSGYFTVPATGSLTLAFPCPAGLLPDPGDPKDRETDFTVWLEDLVTASTITLPEGYSAELPGPVNIDGAFASGRAAWEKTDKGLRAVLEYRPKTAVIRAADVAAFSAMLAPLRTWLSKPLTIAVSDKARAAMPRKDDDGLGDFPVMPTGEGQLNLVNEKFPDTGNHDLRRRALEKTLTLFPQDKATQFKATVQIAWLDVQADKDADALRRLKAPLESGRGAVDVEEVALAEYVQAIALNGDGKPDEALPILERMMAQDGLSAWRRAYAAYQRGWMLRTKDRAQAIKVLNEGIALAAGNEDDLFSVLAVVRMEGNEHAELEKELLAWLEQKPQNAAAVLTALANYGLTLAGSSAEKEKPAAIITILEKAGAPESFGEEFAAALAKLKSGASTNAALALLDKQVKEYLESVKDTLPKADVPAGLKDAAEFRKEAQSVADTDTTGEKSARWELEYLRRFAPDEYYGTALRRAAAFLNYAEQQQEKKEASPLLLKLLDFGQQLPVGSDERHESWLVRCKVLLRTGRGDEALQLYSSLSEDDDVPVQFRVAALAFASDAALELGNAEAALKSWEALGQYSGHFAVADGCFKAALLELDRGNREQAWKWIDKLRALDPEVLKGCTLTTHITPWLKFTADRTAAEKWWDASKVWWPEWEKLAKRIGYKPGKAIVVPAIPSGKELGTEIAQTAGREDYATVAALMDRAARAARWDPLWAEEMAAFGQVMKNIGLEKFTADFPPFVLAVTTQHDSAPPETARKLLYFRVWLIAGQGQWEDALGAAAAFRKISAKPDVLSSAVARMRSVAAQQSKKELDESEEELEKLVATEEPLADHFQNVDVLASLYVARQRRDEAIALLTKSLEAQAVKENPKGRAQLAGSLKKLKDGGDTDTGTGLATAWKRWKEVRQLPWLSYAHPQKLSDFTGDLEEALRLGSDTPITEACKLAALVLDDESQPESQLLMALEKLAFHSVEFAPDEKTAFAWTKALCEENGLSSLIRARLLNRVMMGAFDAEALPFIHRLRNHDGFAPLLDEPAMQPCVPVIELAALTPGDLDAAEGAVKRIFERPLDGVAGLVLQRLITRLAAGGRFEAARKIAADAATAKATEAYKDQRSSLKLTCTRIITTIEALRPAHEALRAWWLKKYPAAPGPLPEYFVRENAALDPPAALAVADHAVRTGSLHYPNLRFWFDVIDDITVTGQETNELGLALLTIMLEKVASDSERATIVSLCRSTVDIDDPPTRKALLEMLAPLRKLSGAPQTADALRTFDLLLQMRLGKGEPSDWIQALGAIKGSRNLSLSRIDTVDAILAREDIDSLREFLPRIPHSLASEPFFLDRLIPAWKAAEMTAEHEEGLSKTRELIPSLVTRAWASADYYAALQAIQLAQTLGEPDLIPKEMTDDLISRIAGTRRQALLGRIAILREEWETAVKALSLIVEKRPGAYPDHFLLGKALLRLGRREEAVPHIKAYIDHSRNEFRLLEAKAMLQEAGNK